MYSYKKILQVVGPSETTWDGCSDVNACVTDVSAAGGGDGSGGEDDDGAGSLDGNNTPVDGTIVVVIVVVVVIIIVVVMQFADVGWIRGAEERTVYI